MIAACLSWYSHATINCQMAATFELRQRSFPTVGVLHIYSTGLYSCFGLLAHCFFMHSHIYFLVPQSSFNKLLKCFWEQWAKLWDTYLYYQRSSKFCFVFPKCFIQHLRLLHSFGVWFLFECFRNCRQNCQRFGLMAFGIKKVCWVMDGSLCHLVLSELSTSFMCLPLHTQNQISGEGESSMS